MRGPTSVTPKGVPPCSSGMTATGSHGYFYSLRGAQPQGEGFSLKPLVPTPNDRTLPPAPSAPPPSSEGGKGLYHIDSPYRPSSGPFGTTFPQGKAFFPPPGNSASSYPKFSAIPRKMHGNPPFGGFSFLDSYCIMEEKIQEVRLCPHLLFI